tara:strand:- start:17263 stop:17460 length:198 start_codon:yes stop_codon:yes gene_type:complete
MTEDLSNFLNKKWDDVNTALQDIPMPTDSNREIKEFNYKLGQHDLLVELFARLGKPNPHMKEEEK